MLGYFHPKIVFFISKFKSYLFEFYLVCEGLAVRLALFLFQLNLILVSQAWEFIEVKEVITPYGRSGS